MLVSSAIVVVKDKAVPLQTWSGPEGSRKLRFPDFMTMEQDVGKFSRCCSKRSSSPVTDLE